MRGQVPLVGQHSELAVGQRDMTPTEQADRMNLKPDLALRLIARHGNAVVSTTLVAVTDPSNPRPDRSGPTDCSSWQTTLLAWK
jgi:hypothetical protein